MTQIDQTFNLAEIDPGIRIAQEVMAAQSTETYAGTERRLLSGVREGLKNLRYAAVASIISIGATAYDATPIHADPYTENAGADYTRVPANTPLLVHAAEPGTSGVKLNVTVVDPAGPGYATVYPCGEDVPLASNLNFVSGQTVPNFVEVKPDSSGNVCVIGSQPAHYVIDTSGSEAPAKAGETPTVVSLFTPYRIMDSRNGGPVPPGVFTIATTGQYIDPTKINLSCDYVEGGRGSERAGGAPIIYLDVFINGLTPDPTPSDPYDDGGDMILGNFIRVGDIVTYHPQGRVNNLGNYTGTIFDYVRSGNKTFQGTFELRRYRLASDAANLIGTTLLSVGLDCE